MKGLMTMTVLLIPLFFVYICTTATLSSSKPGVDIRVTRKGIGYFGQIGAGILREAIQNGSVMERSGKVGLIKYTISGVNVSDLQPLRSFIQRDLTKGIVWELRDVGFNLNANYSLSFFIFKCHGSFRYSVHNTTVSLPITIGVDKEGRPTLVSKCRYEVGTNWSVTFTGQYAAFYNWLARTFKGAFQSFLENMICSAMTTTVNKDAADILGKYPATADLGNVFAVDYGVQGEHPLYNTSYMDIHLKGETFWKKKRASSSLTVPDLPPFNLTGRMIYYFFTDYTFNTLAQVSFKQELLEKSLTYKDLPRDQKYFLNTTCPGNLCFGKLIAQTATQFPNSRAELHIKSSERPVVTISADDVAVTFAANIEFYMRLPSGNTTYIFAIKTTLDTSLHILADDIQKRGRLTAAVQKTSLSVGILDSEIGAINLNLLHTLMDTIVNLYIRPQLNKLGTIGYPLPAVGNSTMYQNVQVVLAKSAIIVGTDIKYTKDDGTFSYTVDKDANWMVELEQEPEMSFEVVDGSDGQKPYKIINL